MVGVSVVDIPINVGKLQNTVPRNVIGMIILTVLIMEKARG